MIPAMGVSKLDVPGNLEPQTCGSRLPGTSNFHTSSLTNLYRIVLYEHTINWYDYTINCLDVVKAHSLTEIVDLQLTQTRVSNLG